MNDRVLVLGANGMLGGSLLRYLTTHTNAQVLGSVRNKLAAEQLKLLGFHNINDGIDVQNKQALRTLFKKFKPTLVLNCVGVIKQLDKSKAHVSTIELNSLLPHRLAQLCDECGAKLVHFSTDCVFSGQLGGYDEKSLPDATDLYGRSKLLGEVDYGKHLTLRTSIIGHELNSSVSLVDWFLNQKGQVNGFAKAIFSGLPTIYIGEFIKNYVLGNDLSGLYHLSVEPIDKFSLLSLVKAEYGLETDIKKDEKFVIDRSLNSNKLRSITGFSPDSWPTLIKKMHDEFVQYFT